MPYICKRNTATRKLSFFHTIKYIIIKKTTLLIALLLVAITHTFAQIPEARTNDMAIRQKDAAAFADSMLRYAPFVFDASIIRFKVFKADNGHIYTSRLVAVNRVRRGELLADTVEVVGRFGCIAKKTPQVPGQWRLFSDYDCEGWPDHFGVTLGGLVDHTPKEDADVLIKDTTNNVFFCRKNSTLPNYYKKYKSYSIYHELWGLFDNFGDSRYHGIFHFKTIAELNTYFERYGLNKEETKMGKQNGNGDATERTQTNTSPYTK
jgi:hypothetical protein